MSLPRLAWEVAEAATEGGPSRVRHNVGSKGQALQLGHYVIEPVSYEDETGVQGGTGVHVFVIDDNGKITREWVSGSLGE